jgi:hypothetical protein
MAEAATKSRPSDFKPRHYDSITRGHEAGYLERHEAGYLERIELLVEVMATPAALITAGQTCMTPPCAKHARVGCW